MVRENTPYIGLIKPDPSDQYNIKDFNDNSDVIDNRFRLTEDNVLTKANISLDNLDEIGNNKLLPPQSGKKNKFLQTNGNKSEWVDIDILSKANTNLDNLSQIGENKLNTTKMYLTGEVSTDVKGLEQLKELKRSTFDLSKFEVVGSPTITDDGIASGFSSTGQQLTGSYITSSVSIDFSKKWSILLKVKTGIAGNYEVPLFLNNTTDNGCFVFVTPTMEIQFTAIETEHIVTPKIQLSAETEYFLKIGWDLTKYYLSVSIDGITWTTKTVDSTTPAYDGQGGIKAIGCRYINSGWQWRGSIDLSQFSITVDGVEVFNGNKTGIDQIKKDDYTVGGNPVISADGIASGFSSSNYISMPFIITKNDTFRIETEFDVDVANVTSTQNYLGLSYNGYTRGELGTSGAINFVWVSDGVKECRVTLDKVYNHYKVATGYRTGEFYIEVEVDGKTYYAKYPSTNNIPDNNYILLGKGIRGDSVALTGAINLNATKLYINDMLVSQPTLRIPYTQSKTGSKIVDAQYRDRVEQVYNEQGQANYYTLSDNDFTLPKGELYGMLDTKLDTHTSNLSIQGKSLISGLSFPSSRYVDLTLGADGSSYIAPANGWFIFRRDTISGYVGIENVGKISNITQNNTSTSAAISIFCPAKKDDTCKIIYSGTANGKRMLRFIYAEGEQN